MIEWRVVYFNRTINDVIVYSNSINRNLDKQDDKGLEFETTVHAGKRVTIRAWYTSVTGQVTTNTVNGDTTFNNLIRRPKHSAGLNVSYRTTNKLQFSTYMQAIGKRNDLFFDMTTFTNQSANLKAYLLLDLSAQYQATKNFSFYASVRNALNAQYEEVYGYNTLGITGTTGLQINF